MRCTFPLALLLVLPSFSLADPPGEVVQPKDGHFAVRFPGKPKEATQTTKTDIGTLKIYTATYALPDGSIYLASFTEFPADVVKADFRGTLFDGVVKGLKGKDGIVVGPEKEIEIGKEKGREVLIDKGKVQSRYRMVVKDNRLIQIAALGTGEFVTGKEATAFLDSFEFK
jgi:hypothetical protein